MFAPFSTEFDKMMTFYGYLDDLLIYVLSRRRFLQKVTENALNPDFWRICEHRARK